MNKEQAEQNRILLCESGSQLYGTATPESDTDYVGVMIAPESYYLGLNSVEEVDCSIVSKREDGKNDSDAVDMKYYELRKYVRLAIDNNPNVIELLFTPDKNVVFSNDLGRVLLNHSHLFPHKGLVQKFIGYGKSQLHRARIKPENYNHLSDAYKSMEDLLFTDATGIPKSEHRHKLLAEYRENGLLKGVSFHNNNASIGDINISLTDKLVNVFYKVSERLSKVGNRQELYTKYGMDTKFCSHAVRLMLEGKELLTTGRLEYPLKDREFLLDIRHGKYELGYIIELVEQMVRDLDSLVKTSVLSERPRVDEVERLLISMVKEHHLFFSNHSSQLSSTESYNR